MDLTKKLTLQRNPSSGRLSAPKARNVKAWGNAPGKEQRNFEALKARHRPDNQSLLFVGGFALA
ncbi:MAG: hypothetical protein AABN95_10675 [Acidobacteriota bacterium]